MPTTSPWLLEVARGYLEREGYIVSSAMAGREGLMLAAAKRPALLALDLMARHVGRGDLRRDAQPFGCRGRDADGEGK